jgi:hypothetical protein
VPGGTLLPYLDVVGTDGFDKWNAVVTGRFAETLERRDACTEDTMYELNSVNNQSLLVTLKTGYPTHAPICHIALLPYPMSSAAQQWLRSVPLGL